MQVDMVSNLAKVIMPLLVGLLFVISYLFANKNEFFQFIAYFPRRREGSIKIGSLIFGIVFILVALYNFLRHY